MSTKIIVHVSEVDITQNGGMGRVEYFWKQAFEKKGYQFIHIGPKEVGDLIHKGFFPYKAYFYFKSLKIKPSAFIVHEPASGVFANKGIPCFLESHGIERQAWENSGTNKSIKARMLFPIWRLRNCDLGIKKSDKLLLINSDDKSFVKNKYKRNENDIFIFKNGVIAPTTNVVTVQNENFTILFNGSWIERKGINVLIAAADILFKKDIKDIYYLLIGTGKSKEEVLGNWPLYLRKFVKVIPKFESTDETKLINESNLFVLPSFSEGQPLSLLQAMSLGKCCITTNTCGQKDIITDEHNGFLVPTGDPLTLSDKILECYKNISKSEKIGSNAKKDMTERSWDIVSNEVVEFIIKNIS